MTVLSPSGIAGYASGAGFKGNALVIAVAVALAESGGNTAAQHVNTNGSVDRGLWQINSVHSQYNASALLTPGYNATAAFQISGGGSNWNPWVTFTTGAYKRFLSAASSAVVGKPTGGVTTPVPGPVKNPFTNTTVDQVFNQKGLWRWYAQNGGRGTWMYNGTTEKGIDYSNSWGTPIGIVMGGTVVRIVHNNNSIGDVVEIKAGDGSVWLYQHIRTKVKVGQAVSTGDVVGTEDGLPVDQFSTGPHIEVRYCPPGKWSANTISWLEPWVNPFSLFSRAGSLMATGSGSTSGTPGTTPGSTSGATFGMGVIVSAATWTPLLDQVHETLIATPGFYGIALALDEAEQFPGYIDLTAPQPDFVIVGQDTGVAPPDVTGIVRSIGASITDNFVPFAIRSGLVTLGAVLVLALTIKAVEGPVATIAPFVAAAA